MIRERIAAWRLEVQIKVAERRLERIRRRPHTVANLNAAIDRTARLVSQRQGLSAEARRVLGVS